MAGSQGGQIAAAFAHHPDWILVACRDGAIAGFATYRLDRGSGVGEIGNNAVDPAWQGRGIAAALYRRVLDCFRQHGLRIAKVTTGLDAAHAPARAAYRKAGFGPAVSSVTLYQDLARSGEGARDTSA